MRNIKGQFIKGHISSCKNCGKCGSFIGKNEHICIPGPTKGKRLSKRHKKKISKAKIGHTPWNKGLKGFMAGEKNTNWKGNDASYYAIHIWLKTNYGKADHCENDLIHKSCKYEWANISGEYKRDVNDYKQLCIKCHRIMDGNIKNLTSWKGEKKECL